MDVITRKHLKQSLKKGRKREYYEKSYNIYTADEAKAKNIEFKRWVDCKKGEYGVSDDGYVAICLNVRKYKKKLNYVFPFGQQFATIKDKKGTLLYEPHRLTGNYSGVSTKSNEELNQNKRVYKDFAKAYAMQLMVGDVNYYALGKMLYGGKPKPELTAKKILKKEYMKKMVDEQMRKILDSKEISEGSVLDMVTDAHEVAKLKSDPGNMLRAAENLIGILGMKDKKKEEINELTADTMSWEQITDSLEEDKIESGQTEDIPQITG